MDRRMSAALDKYITGNWGEDQVRDIENMERVKKRKIKEIVVELQLSGYTVDRMDEFSEANNISVTELIKRCVEHCESTNFF